MRHSTARFGRLRPASNRPIARIQLDDSTHIDYKGALRAVLPQGRDPASPPAIMTGVLAGQPVLCQTRSRALTWRFALARRHHTGRQPQPAPTWARWPGTPTPDASGGGYSNLFPRPSYQDGLAQAHATRGVPDVAANADSSTVIAQAYSNGELRPDASTSAAAPLWAGVIDLYLNSPESPGLS
jgi:hypothetical protein